MGKIVMPKNSALLSEIEAVLRIYYEAEDWMENDLYKEKLKREIGDDQYSSSYTKKAQITSYFGFTEWEDIKNARSSRRITNSGRRMYTALQNNDSDQIYNIIMESLETVTFGRDNFGVPESDSDIEPPNLFIRAILDLDYLTYKEFAFLLWELEDKGNNYTDAIRELRGLRNNNELVLDKSAEKYADCKPIMVLERWGFLEELNESTSFGKKIAINEDVKRKYSIRLRNLKIYNVDRDIEYDEKDKKNELEKIREIGGNNILLYGVPGSGKSYTISKEYCDDEAKIERIVFHPDYMNTDFIGQILPTIKEDKTITYEFTPGPFTKIMKKAYEDPTNRYYLIIEEINRGNAPAIFGDVFQLLDRNSDGSSCYSIKNYNVANIIYGDDDRPISIPSNLFILATMNTADQNVFTLDTAFQRRWIMRLIKNDVSSANHADIEILDTGISWGVFNITINEFILANNSSTMSSEDKRLGAYFITRDILESNDESLFSEKVIKYLWDDAFKFARNKLFDSKYNSLESVIEDFDNFDGFNRFNIFTSEVRDLLRNNENMREINLRRQDPKEIAEE